MRGGGSRGGGGRPGSRCFLLLLGIMTWQADPTSAQAHWSPTTSASLLVGRMTDDAWEDVFLDPGGLGFPDSRLLGVTLAREWRRAGSALSFGVELQAVRHSGVQDHLEVNAPITARLHLPGGAVPGSLALGLGLSNASDRPEVELARSGETQRTLAYWLIESELGPWSRGPSIFLRLHHRSDAFGLFDADAGSNALVVGLRRRW
jgi:hypothetical protein